MMQYRLESVVWGEDHHGVYWIAYAVDAKTGELLGTIGTYNRVNADGKRDPKADQEKLLASFGTLENRDVANEANVAIPAKAGT